MIDISCAFPAHPRLGAIARHAEGLGYTRCWTYDSPALYGDVWVACAEIARSTERIGFGPAVLVPGLRHPLVNASAIAQLAGMAPGRLAVAIGTGFTGRMAMGQRPYPWSFVRTYVAQLRALLRGEEVEYDGALIRMIPSEGFLPERPIDVPILIGANGPKGLEVARELGDGVMSIGPGFPEFAWSAVLAFGTVLDDGEPLDSPRVIEAAGPALAVVYHGAYEADPAVIEVLPNGPAWRDELEAIPIERRHLATHRDHLWRLTDRDRLAIDPSLFPVMTWTGSRTEIHERLVALGESGATEILDQPMGPDLERELDAFMDAARG